MMMINDFNLLWTENWAQHFLSDLLFFFFFSISKAETPTSLRQYTDKNLVSSF